MPRCSAVASGCTTPSAAGPSAPRPRRVPVANIADLPPDISFEIGACLGIPAMTAHRCLFADGPLDGLRVLVSGGGGAVGSYAVQLARWGGAAWVGATASGGWKTEDAQAAGAEAVFDYRTPDCADRILAATGGVDRIIEIDVAGNVALWSAVVVLNGSVIGYASRGGASPGIPWCFATLMRKNVNLRGVVLNSAPAAARRQAMDDITGWLRQAPRLHRIAATFPLAQTAAAHDAVEAGTKRGTVVVVL